MAPPRRARRPLLCVDALEDRTTPALIGLEAADLEVFAGSGVDGGGDVAMKPDGTGFVVTYQSPDASGGGVYFKRYDANWQLVQGPVAVNTFTANDQNTPSVGVDGNGNFVIAWQSNGQDPGDSAVQSGVYARRFRADGSAIDAAGFRVNTTTAGPQREPDVAVNADGRFVVVYRTGVSAADILTQSYSRITAGGDGNPTKAGVEVTVNDTGLSTAAQTAPAVAIDAAGGYVVAYQSVDQDYPGANDFGIYARRMNADGSSAGAEFLVNTVTLGNQRTPDVAMDGGGNFTVVWSSDNVDGSGTAVVLRRYSAAGTALGGSVQVNTAIMLRDQTNPHVSINAAGTTVVTWTGEEADGNGNGTDLYFKTYSAAGAGLTGDTVVNSATANNNAAEDNATPAVNAAGDFVVLFDSDAGASRDAYLRRFAEAPLVSFAAATASGPESANASVGLTRSGAAYVLANVATTVPVTLAGGAATPGADFTTTFPASVTFAADGSTARTVTILVADDNTTEPDETIVLGFGAVTGGAAAGQTAHTYTIRDNDAPPPAITVDSPSAAEGNAGTTTLTFTVSLDAASTSTVTVEFTTANGIATTADGDYAATSGTLTFTPGQTSKLVTVLVNGDAKFEPDEKFTLVLSNPTNATLGNDTGTGTITNDDTAPIVSLSVSPASIAESGGSATVTATLDAASGFATTVTLTLGGTATAADYSVSPATITIPAGSLSGTATITAAGDTVDEANETVTVAIDSATNATAGGTTQTVTVTDDDPGPTANGQTVTTDQDIPQAVTLTGSDPSSPPLPLTYTITVLPQHGTLSGTAPSLLYTPDAGYSGPDAFQFTASNGVTTSSPATVSIAVTPAPAVSIDDATVSEGDLYSSTATFTVRLSGPSGQTVTLSYATANDSATAGADYTATSGTLTFAPGETSKTIAVTVPGDRLFEGDETFAVNLSALSYGSFADAQGVGTVADDDAAASITVVSGAGQEATVNTAFGQPLRAVVLNAAGVQVEGVTVTFTPPAAGASAAVAGATAVSDGAGYVSSGTVTANGTAGGPYLVTARAAGGSAPATTFALTNVPLTLFSVGDASTLEGDAGTTTLEFTVTAGPVNTLSTSTVSYSVANGTADGSDYETRTAGTLSFAPGTATQTIRVTVRTDVLSEDDETFVVTLSDPTNAGLADAQAVGTIRDDDPLPAVSVGDVTQAEGDAGTTAVTFTVSLSAYSGRTVTVAYATADGTAVAGTDYAAASGTLTFAPGERSKDVTVMVNGDMLYDADRTFVLNLSAPSNATVADGQAVGTITDDDPAPTLGIGDAAVSEADGTAVFTITLTGATAVPISVSYATAPGTAVAAGPAAPGTPDYTATAGTVTFQPSAAGTQTLTVAVPLANDAVKEAAEQFAVNLTDPTNGATTTDAQGVAAVADDDATPALSVDSPTAVEGTAGTTALVFTVTLSAASGQAVTVDYLTADGTAAAADGDYRPTSGTLTFLPGETSKTVAVLVNGDRKYEPDETVRLTLTNPVNAALAAGVVTGVGTIRNDDAVPAVTLSVSGSPATEGRGPVTLTATLSHPTSSPVTVSIGAVGSITPGVSSPLGAVIRIDANQLSNSVTLSAPVNDRDEADNTVTYTVAAAVNAVVAAPQRVTAVFRDDDLPVAAPDAYTTAEDTLLTVGGPGLLANDNAAPGSVAELVGPGPAHGTVTLAGGGFTYTPAPDYNGPDAFRYRVRNPAGELSDPVTVNLSVTATNDAPTFVAGPDQTNPRGSGPQTVAGWATGVTAGPPDERGQSLTFLITTDNPGLFAALPAIDPATGALTYTPAPFAYGTATVTVRLMDGSGTPAGGADRSGPQTFTITVNKHLTDSRPAGQNEVPLFAVGAGDGGPGTVTVFSADGSAAYTVRPFADGTGARAVVADVSGDGVPDVVAGTGPGAAAVVAVVDGVTRQVVRTFAPFEPGFTGGVFVAAGDVSGDGVADVAVSADTSGGPRVVVYDGRTGAVLADFLGIDDINFRGGARVTMADVNADGRADLVVAAGAGGGPRVAVFDGATVRAGQTPARLVADFFAFEPALRDGVYLSAGDLNGDGFDDLIFGGGPGGSSRVLAFDSQSLFGPAGGRFVPLSNFFAGDPELRTGVRLAAKDLDGDRRADLVTAVPTGAGSDVAVTLGKNVTADGADGDTLPDPFPGLLSGAYVG